MLTLSVDDEASVAVWLFSGRHNSDEDYERYVQSLGDLRARATRRGRGTGLMIAERENPTPNAAWRRRMAEASRDYPPNCVYVLVSESMVVRGVMTAINWLRPPTFEFTAAATVEEGLDWLRARRDEATLATVVRLIAAAKTEAAKTARAS